MNTAMLIPFGSERESIRGLAHLFEHVVIHKMLYQLHDQDLHGFTTEDYIVMFSQKGDISSMYKTLKEFEIDEETLEKEKGALIAEIGRESSRKEEAFFSFVWQDTSYMYSPLGTAEAVRTIGVDDIYELKNRILQGPIYFYTPQGVHIEGPEEVEEDGEIFIPDEDWIGSFGNDEYYIHYLEGEGEQFHRTLDAFYLLQRIANKIFPGYTTGLYEKRYLAVFVANTKGWMSEYQVLSHKRRVLDDIESELEELRKDFGSRGLNELESLYFYNIPWQDRLNQLASITDEELVSAFRMISL